MPWVPLKFGATASIPPEDQQIFPLVLLRHRRKWQRGEKGQIIHVIAMKMVLSSLEGFGDPRGRQPTP